MQQQQKMMNEEMKEFLNEKLGLLDTTALSALTYKGIREVLIPKFGSEEVGKLKDEIKGFLVNYATTHLNSNEHKDEKNVNQVDEEKEEKNGGSPDDESEEDENDDENGSKSKSGSDDTDDSDETDDTDDEDADDPAIAVLPSEWKDLFGEICWVKGQKSFPWWPAYIYNPSRLNDKLKSKAIPVAGKKHTVLYFGSRDFGFVTPNQIKMPFEAFREEYSKQTISKKDQTWWARSIPEAEEELAKPKEERMYIEKRSRQRKSTSGNKKKRSLPVAKTTPKKTPTKEKSSKSQPDEKAEEDDEDEDEKEEEERNDDHDNDDEDEDEVELDEEDDSDSDEEAEADFDESPKKKLKSLPKEKQKSGGDKPKKVKNEDKNMSTSQLVEKYRNKSLPPDASKKKRAVKFIQSIQRVFSPGKGKGGSSGGDGGGGGSGEKKSSKSSDKSSKSNHESSSSSSSSAKNKPKSDSAKSKPDSQKKRKAEEETLAEAERERIKKLQKLSDVPVWKQIRKESGPGTSSVSTEKISKGVKSKPEQMPSSTQKVEETREQRAKRLTGLIDQHLKKSPPNIDLALKCMGKAKDMNLTIDELRGSGFAEAINQLRKHSDSQISNEAKSIRNYLKNALTQQAPPLNTPLQSSSVANTPPPINPTTSGINETTLEPHNTRETSVETVALDAVAVAVAASAKQEVEPTSGNIMPVTENNNNNIREGNSYECDFELRSSSLHFPTSVALLLDPASALHTLPRQTIERIVEVVTRNHPDTNLETFEKYTTSIHKLAYELKSHSSLLEGFLSKPSVANIEYLVRTVPDNWNSLPDPDTSN